MGPFSIDKHNIFSVIVPTDNYFAGAGAGAVAGADVAGAEVAGAAGAAGALGASDLFS